MVNEEREQHTITHNIARSNIIGGDPQGSRFDAGGSYLGPPRKSALTKHSMVIDRANALGYSTKVLEKDNVVKQSMVDQILNPIKQDLSYRNNIFVRNSNHEADDMDPKKKKYIKRKMFLDFLGCGFH